METKTMSFRDTIILAMSEEMRRDENVFLMGEDVGVFGGDFGTSVGMLEEFGLGLFVSTIPLLHEYDIYQGQMMSDQASDRLHFQSKLGHYRHEHGLQLS